jgi:hypothetical protein
VITTSDTGVEGLKALVGVTVTRVQCAAPMSDLTLELDDGTTLETFSHRDVNWECWVGPEYVER